jgi:fructose-bisphosphate aldolase class II
MPIVETSELVAAAAAAGCGIAAFNVITLEHVEAVVTGAQQANRAVIVQVSENALRFHDGRLRPLAAAVRAAAADASVPVSLHLDHVESRALLRQAPEHGFSSVMFDASMLAYQENVRAVGAAVQFAHDHGMWLEGELGVVGGKDGGPSLSAHAPGSRTDPEQARSYVDDTGVDALAVAVGSSHAMTSRTAVLDHDLIGALRRLVPVPLVLHGSSGVPDDSLADAIGHGIVKVNIGTALNIAFTAAVRDWLDANRTAVDPRRYVAPGRAAMADVVAHLLTVVTRPDVQRVPDNTRSFSEGE